MYPRTEAALIGASYRWNFPVVFLTQADMLSRRMLQRSCDRATRFLKFIGANLPDRPDTSSNFLLMNVIRDAHTLSFGFIRPHIVYVKRLPDKTILGKKVLFRKMVSPNRAASFIVFSLRRSRNSRLTNAQTRREQSSKFGSHGETLREDRTFINSSFRDSKICESPSRSKVHE